MENINSLNAQIESAIIEINDRELLVLTIAARFSNGYSGHIEGGYATYIPNDWKHHDPQSSFAHLLWHWLKVTDSMNVQEMVGKVVRVTVEGYSSTPITVQHATKDFSFKPSEVVKDRLITAATAHLPEVNNG